jgi:hypothetical protein
MRFDRLVARVLMIAALTGCSLAELQPRVTHKPQRCKWGHVAVDAIGAVGTGVAGTYLLATARPGNWFGIPWDLEQKGAGWSLLAISAIYGASAIYGTDVGSGCERNNETLERQRIVREATFAQRERAWAITREAAAVARAGDCNQVIVLSSQVFELDAEFHSTVFARDVAIARCLALPRYSIK